MGNVQASRWLPILAAAFVAAQSAGCSSSTARAPGGSGSSDVGRFTATGPDGTSVTVPDGKPAVIYFFAAGCSQGAPAVAAAQRQAPGATYVAVDLDPGATQAGARAVLRAAGAGDTGLAVSTDTSLVTRYGVATLGTTVVLDANGTPVYNGVEAATGAITTAVTGAASAQRHP